MWVIPYCIIYSKKVTIKKTFKNNCGVGRYDIAKTTEMQHINSHTSLFRSKTAQISLAKGKPYLE